MRGDGWVLGALILTGCYTAPDWRPDPEAAGGSAGASSGGEQTGGTGPVPASGGAGSHAGGSAGDSSASGGNGPQGPRCDWIPECEPLLGACTVTYATTCGDARQGTFGCGHDGEDWGATGWAFDDGTSFACHRSGSEQDCVQAMSDTSRHCVNLLNQFRDDLVGTGCSGVPSCPQDSTCSRTFTYCSEDRAAFSFTCTGAEGYASGYYVSDGTEFVWWSSPAEPEYPSAVEAATAFNEYCK